ncbi:hypothetical protein [Streptomyces sp. CBMA156]|uniref:hypothetical protein n=1 Tax=Streptomyces sp. CBMA156 TaxID=1930280 RepID=UPI0016618FDD|nr:hypothetical protein [Streptomyces sp. CBMA156]
MTASAPSLPRPGRAAFAGRPVGALLVLLLAALLTLLPCAGQAKAVDGPGHPAPPQAPVSAVTVLNVVSVQVATGQASRTGHAAKVAKAGKSSDHHRTAEEQGHWILCTADGEPPRNNGCSSHPFCPQDAQLPNPPPQPQPAVSPLTPAAPEAPPRVVPTGLLDGSHPVPDLHELQVHRS